MSSKNKKPVIGVLALQGAVQPHKLHIEAAGGEFRAVRTPAQFEEVDGFILPGGESTTMLKLINAFDLWEPLENQFAKKPVWGICAGCILIAAKVTDPAQKSFGLLPITVQRNAYGRQLQSHHAEINGYPVSFIRAPVITGISDRKIEVLARHVGNPVWIRMDKFMVSTFHAELTGAYPSPMHQVFIDCVR